MPLINSWRLFVMSQITIFVLKHLLRHGRQKVSLDYQNVPSKPKYISWKKFYIKLGTTYKYIKPIKVTYVGRAEDSLNLGSIWINNNDNVNKILDRANTLFKSQYPHDTPDGVHAYGPDIMMIEDQIYDINKDLIYWRTPLRSPVLVSITPLFYSQITELQYYTTYYPHINKVMLPVE